MAELVIVVGERLMQLTTEQISRYEKDGYIHLGKCFSSAEVAILRQEARRLGSPERSLREANLVDDKTGVIWRSYALDRDSAPFNAATRLPRIIERARAILGPHVYLWQAHMNHKVAGKGEAWQWHQDYTAWWQDGMPRGGIHDCLTFMLMLDESTPENGPLEIIPGSHHGHHGEQGYWDTEGGKFALQAIPPEKVADLKQRNGVVQVLGEAGSMVIVAGMVIHGSKENKSNMPRCNAFLAYNRTDNRPTRTESLRKHVSPFQLNHLSDEISPVDDGALEHLARTA